MTFHITITNNETGETLADLDSCAIIGAIDVEEKGTREIAMFDCNGIVLAATAADAIVNAREAIEDMPKAHRRKIERVAKKVLRNRKKKAAK